MNPDISNLSIGDHHYMAYVGSPALYDVIGASQFRLLCTLGLRAHHRVLDFGCGSLRAGRLFISYLNEGCYYGIDPNEWLINDAIKNEIGEDLIRIKKPFFGYNDDFTLGSFDVNFDYIISNSIFTHSGSEQVIKGLKSFKAGLAPEGIIAASFMEGSIDYTGSEWVYPEVITFRRSTILEFAQTAGLFATPIPWYHPGLTWFIFANTAERLPDRTMMRYLRGAILSNSEFNSSWKPEDQMRDNLKRVLKRMAPGRLFAFIRSILAHRRAGEDN
jgi:SAM-dependent methyltransferase